MTWTEISKRSGERKRADNTNILQKDLEDSAGLLIDQTRDTLDAASTSKTTDSRLGDALDVVAQDLAVTLCATLSETLEIKSVAADLEEKMISNAPFHPCHGQTLSCDEVFCEKRDEDAVCGQRVAGAVMGFRLRGASVDIAPTSAPRDRIVDGCLVRL